MVSVNPGITSTNAPEARNRLYRRSGITYVCQNCFWLASADRRNVEGAAKISKDVCGNPARYIGDGLGMFEKLAEDLQLSH